MHIRCISDESVGRDLSGIFMIWCWTTYKSVKLSLMYISRVGNIFKVDKQCRPNAKNMRIYHMNLWKKRWMQYSTHVKSYEQKCVQPCVLRHSPMRIKSSHCLISHAIIRFRAAFLKISKQTTHKCALAHYHKREQFISKAFCFEILC